VKHVEPSARISERCSAAVRRY